MNYDTQTLKTLTDLLSYKIGEKYLAKEIIQMKIELEDDEIIAKAMKEYEENVIKNLYNLVSIKKWSAEKSYFDDFGKTISRQPNLTAGFIERHLDVINWDTLAKEQDLPDSFWLKHKNIIPTWGYILEFQGLSEETIEELDEILQDTCLCNTQEPCENCQEVFEYNNVDADDVDIYYGMNEDEETIDFHGQGVADW